MDVWCLWSETWLPPAEAGGAVVLEALRPEPLLAASDVVKGVVTPASLKPGFAQKSHAAHAAWPRNGRVQPLTLQALRRFAKTGRVIFSEALRAEPLLAASDGVENATAFAPQEPGFAQTWYPRSRHMICIRRPCAWRVVASRQGYKPSLDRWSRSAETLERVAAVADWTASEQPLGVRQEVQRDLLHAPG